MKYTEEEEAQNLKEEERQEKLSALEAKRYTHPKPTHIDVEVIVSTSIRVQVPLGPGDTWNGKPVFESREAVADAMHAVRQAAEESLDTSQFPKTGLEVSSTVRNYYEMFLWSKQECENEDTPCDGCEGIE